MKMSDNMGYKPQVLSAKISGERETAIRVILLPSIFPSTRVFSNELALCITGFPGGALVKDLSVNERDAVSISG